MKLRPGPKKKPLQKRKEASFISHAHEEGAQQKRPASALTNLLFEQKRTATYT